MKNQKRANNKVKKEAVQPFLFLTLLFCAFARSPVYAATY